MDIGEYVINVPSAVVAIKYMDRGFERRYGGFRRWAAFIADCRKYRLKLAAHRNRCSGRNNKPVNPDGTELQQIYNDHPKDLY